MKRPLGLAALSILIFLARFAYAQSDKSHYTIFNPTPQDEMREWRTDHAGVSPFTVDAGHFEAQVDFYSYAYEEFTSPVSFFGGPRLTVHRESWGSGETVIKAGVLNSVELELEIDGYVWVRDKTFYANTPFLYRKSTGKGFGDISTRIKWNLWGNDGGKTALSLSGTVIYPIADRSFFDQGYRGGPSLEFAAQLPWAFELRVDCQGILYKSDELIVSSNPLATEIRVNGGGIDVDMIYLASISHQIIGPLSGYVMVETHTYTQDFDWHGSVKTGLNYRLAKNVELYAGSFFGFHGETSDYNPFVGIGVRF